jgi:hypothetical protein
MKVIDKITAYHQKQQNSDNEDTATTTAANRLPALSLEFFPPKTQDGVVVRVCLILRFTLCAAVLALKLFYSSFND